MKSDPKSKGQRSDANVSLTCEYCGKKFKQYSRLRVHKQIHTGEKDFKCTFCTYSFNDTFALNIHIRSHTKEKPFHCPHPNCSSSFSSASGLKNHALVHRKTDEKIPRYQCQVSGCGYKTIRKPRLTVHMRVHSTLKPFACDLCPFRSKEKGSLVRHLKHVHSTEKPFKCPQENCNYSAKERHLLTEHLKIHSDERAFPCPFPGCIHKSKRKGDLRKHMRVHTGKKLFKCSFCPRAFADKSNLTSHTRTHTGERPYSCKICPYRSKTSNGLNSHNRSHTGVRPYPCQSCPYRARTPGNLAAHSLIHTGERPYPCPKCPYRARTKEVVTNHVRRIHGEKRTRKRKRSTLQGQLTRLLKCMVINCGYSTRENSSLAIHLNKVHKLPKVLL